MKNDPWGRLTAEDAQELLDEVRQMRRELDDLKVKRDKLMQANQKVAGLRSDLLKNVKTTDEISQDITDALAGSETTN